MTGNENNDFQLLEEKIYIINDEVYLNADKNRRKETAVHDIVFLNGRIIFALKSGDVFSITSRLTDILLRIDLHEYQDRSCKYCRLEVIGNDLYVSYGRKIFKNNVNDCCQIPDIEHSGGYIYDISRTEDKGCSALLINYRDKKINGANHSVVYMLNNFITNNISELKTIEHTTTSQGFKGWNRFSEPFNRGSAVYLTANINDNLEEAGLYLFSCEAVWDGEKERYICLKCVKNAEECFGNRHIMSVERALFFKYNNREYVATTSIDRCVEILDITGTEANLIYHIDEHTDGVTCMDVIDENTIYTSHYSGEVCRWTKSENVWKCKTIAKPHSNEWVWVIKHAKLVDTDYMIASSYDHNISITNAKSGKFEILEGCKGRVKAFDFLNNNSIVAAYDYKIDDKDKFSVHVFKNIDFTTGIAESTVIYNSPAYVQCMCTDKDNLYLVVNQDAHLHTVMFPNQAVFRLSQLTDSDNKVNINAVLIGNIDNLNHHRSDTMFFFHCQAVPFRQRL